MPINEQFLLAIQLQICLIACLVNFSFISAPCNRPTKITTATATEETKTTTTIATTMINRIIPRPLVTAFHRKRKKENPKITSEEGRIIP